ncbi:S-layer homology domain-containing protein [Paenibacillus nasutitermitis]|uniref:SLH domain-containing protein n=1 Tax=Paenibacillus nasutitermitis TaxID=1652958 RepID=A0A916YWN0_9BACL|nr:S-layer homology domain-containing protein [Paenibacillus nasutitermitis]GGD64777.1 hypothetical protein GCM10010911_23200 [Paenibacillus nasutitermitis]
MHNINKWYKGISSLVIFSVISSFTLTGGAVFADSAAATKFNDVPASHWAQKHITKLALQGIVKGNNGVFKPSDNVSRQEAVTMVIRFMGMEDEVKPDQAVVFSNSFKVNDYFKPYIALAFQKGLLDRSDEFKEAEADQTADWGAKKASREWITKLVVKAIGKESVAAGMASTQVAFSDRSTVSQGYAGYVNAAVSLKLVNGVTADKFEPKGAITRASMATLLSRAESQFPVSFSGQENGILSAKTNVALEVYRQGKSDLKLTLSPDTNVYRFDSDKPLSPEQLTPNTNVMVIADGDKALYVEQLDDSQQVEKLTGTFDRIVPAENKLWVWVKDNPVSVIYDSSVTVKDGSGSVIPVTSLVKDSKVEITRDTYRETPRVQSITVQSAPVNKTGTGTVKNVDTATSSITVTDSASNAEEHLNISPQAVILWQGSILQGGITQIRTGDSLSYEIQDSVVTRITVQQTSAKTIKGEFYSASSDGKTIQYIRDGGTQLDAKFVADTTQVTIEGLTSTALTDLVKGDVLELTLNDQDKVSAIKVVNRKVEYVNGAVIVSYDPELKALVVKNGSKLIPVYLTDDTKIEMNGAVINLFNAAPLLIKDRKITIGYTDDKAVSVQFVYKYTGSVVSINQTSRQLNLMMAGGSSFTIGFDSLAVDALGKTMTISDVKPGDTVTVLLNASQDKAVNLQLHTTKQVEVVSVDVNSKKIQLKNSDQSTADWAASDWSIYNEKEELVTINALAAGQVGNITFVGNQPTSFKKVAVTTGRVAAIAADKVTVANTGGGSIDIPLGSAIMVVKNGVSGTSAAVLQAGDRVEVRKDATDQTLITVNSGIAKTFWKFDSATSLLSVKRSSLADTNFTYKVTSMTKVWQGDTAISLTDLKEGDSITLYINQGELLEIVRKG